MDIVALHGFLGLPSDWDFLKPKFAVNLYDYTQYNFWEFADKFNQMVPLTPKILLGYSLGGRLAMHALLSQPDLWEAAIFVSVHPGGTDAQRHQENIDWARKFKNDPWDQILFEWNSQTTLRTSSPIQRNESDFDRNVLAEMLERWSVAKQEDLTRRIQELNKPILWIAGERDLSYRQRAHSMQFFHPLSKIWIAPNAGHRVPWDIPKIFIQQINFFKEELYDNGHTPLESHKNL